MPIIDMESDSNRNVGRPDLSGELGFVPAPRETDPTPVVTILVQDRPPPWSPGHAHGKDRGVNTFPEVESRPKIET